MVADVEAALAIALLVASYAVQHLARRLAIYPLGGPCNIAETVTWPRLGSPAGRTR